MKRQFTSRIAAKGLIIAVAIGVSGCESISGPFDAITSRPPAPDEFAVLARKPLQMPRSVDLPEPRLGERSVLEPDPSQDAIVALLGSSAAKQVQPVSAGESALLSAANARAEQTEIRRVLQEETLAAEESQPYEAPTIFELFSDEEDAPDPETLINPAAESRRLQAEGVAAAPIDPTEAPADAVAENDFAAEEAEERSPRRGRIITPSVSQKSTPAFE
ncbi:MAG: DUF3035 domain-containing protein [Pseudomonadota bacterium]